MPLTSSTLKAARPTKTSFWEAALLFIGSSLFALAVIEIFFRLTYHPPAENKELPKTLIHQASGNLQLLYKPMPGVYEDKDKGFTVKINSLGFRGREYSLKKPSNTKRIVFLGDSITYGLNLDDQDTLPLKIEKKFTDQGKAVEVLNLGVNGYETRQEVEFFKEIGLNLQPDLLIVGYTLNDCMHASMEIDTLENQGRWQIPTEELPWEMQIPRFLYKHSYFFQYLDRQCHLFDANPKMQGFLRGKKSVWHFIRDRNQKIKDAPDSEYQQLKTKIMEDARKAGTKEANLKYMLSFVGIDNYVMQASHWNVTEKAYEELKAITMEKKIPVVVVIFPFMIDLDHYALQSVHDFVRKKLEGMGFKVYDSKEAVHDWYQEYGEKLMIDPIHFSPLGNTLMANYIYGEILKTDPVLGWEKSSGQTDLSTDSAQQAELSHTENMAPKAEPLKRKSIFKRGRRPLLFAY